MLMMQVVSNLPFNISTDVVKLLLPMGDIFSKVVLLLQVNHYLFLEDHSKCYIFTVTSFFPLILGRGSIAIG